MEILTSSIIKKWRADKLKNDFWNKKEVKWSIKIKKTKPTPKSITHKNPMYISASFIRAKVPISIKYRKPVYSNINKFVLHV